MEGRYEPIAIEEIGEGIPPGSSSVLSLFIRWERGQLRWHDPETGEHTPTFEREKARADAAEEARAQAEQGRLESGQTRLMAEARVRALEPELARREAEG